MNIFFIGCVKSSKIFLENLIQEEQKIVGVIAKKSSTYNSDFEDLGTVCETNNIAYKYINKVNTEEAKAFIGSKSPDILCCFGWSELLDEEVINIPRIGCLGFHPAAIPQNKGRHPIIWALALGLKQTASTFFWLDTGADSGAIASQVPIIINYSDDASTLYERIMKTAVIQLDKLLKDIKNGKEMRLEQKCDSGNTWRKRGKKDGEIDWRMSSLNIYNLVRSLTHPYVGAHCVFNQKEYKIWKVKEILSDKYNNIEPGKVLSITNKGHLIVKSGDNLIEIIDSELNILSIKIGEYLL